MTALLPDIPLYVYFMLFAPIALLVLAASYKSLQVRAARTWPSASGIVVESGELRRKVKVPSRRRPRFEERSFANVVYQYEIAGQPHTNSRVTIGEDRGNFEVAETIARYPVGKRVTVYYNPARPTQAVLERELGGMWSRIAWIVVGFTVIVFGAIVGFNKLTQVAADHVVNAPLTVAIGLFGALMALAALGVQRLASQARHWPVVKGIISTSGLEAFRTLSDGEEQEPISVDARIEYTYRFHGRDYSGTAVSLRGEVGTTTDGAIQRWAKRYRDGQIVDVYVNPAKPSESVLEPRARGIWVMWVMAAALLAMAAFVATRS